MNNTITQRKHIEEVFYQKSQFYIIRNNTNIQNAARNVSTATKIALSVLKNANTAKGNINLKRLKAEWDDNYLSTLLQEGTF